MMNVTPKLRPTVTIFHCVNYITSEVITKQKSNLPTCYIGTLNVSLYVTNDIQGVLDVALPKKKDQKNLRV